MSWLNWGSTLYYSCFVTWVITLPFASARGYKPLVIRFFLALRYLAGSTSTSTSRFYRSGEHDHLHPRGIYWWKSLVACYAFPFSGCYSVGRIGRCCHHVLLLRLVRASYKEEVIMLLVLGYSYHVIGIGENSSVTHPLTLNRQLVQHFVGYST